MFLAFFIPQKTNFLKFVLFKSQALALRDGKTFFRLRYATLPFFMNILEERKALSRMSF